MRKQETKTVDEIKGRTKQSPLEARLLADMRAAGLPEPETQLIRFTAYGNVQPAHRPRAYRVGKGVRMRNDDRHTNWMETIKMQALNHRPETLLDGPLRVTMTVYLLRPKGAKNRLYPHVKPDLSNLVKAVEDALNGLIWTDDSRIVDLRTSKLYGDPTRVEVEIEELRS